ncbi:hypothetical protein C2I36_04775 [Rhodobacteraceae bacterium WD3A24]|nr:hypothetical protein C2I36_04775 [Rhodobacteraceae bacterium WD3A24]
MINIVILFLVAMLVIGVVSKLRTVSARRIGRRRGGGALPGKPRKCRQCGRFLIGSDRCDCDKR